MKLNTITGDKIESEIIAAIPNASVVVKNNTLHELAVGDLRIVVGSYSIEVTKVVRPKKWVARAIVAEVPIQIEAQTKEEVESKVGAFNATQNNDVTFTITEQDA